MKPPGFLFPEPTAVWRLRMITVLEEWRGTAVRLPDHVLWSMKHQAGQLAVDCPSLEIYRFHWPLPGEECGASMASLDLGGFLDLAGRFAPGTPLVLTAEGFSFTSEFSLRPVVERRPRPELLAQAIYRLRVEPGYRVVLPPDALWALSLAAGGTMACKTAMWTLEGSFPPDGLRPGYPAEVAIEEDGAILLPEVLHQYHQLQPGSPLRLEVSADTRRSSFRLEPDLSLP